MGSKESKQVILNFIKKCDGKATKNDVVKYMESDEVNEIDRTSRITTLNLIDALEFPDHHIIIEKGKRRGQSHRLLFNDKNEFNTICATIEALERMSNNFTKGVTDGASLKIGKHGRNIYHFVQLKLYIGISLTASRIYDSIKSADDRDALHLKLVKVMASLNKINKAIIVPMILRGLKEFSEELKASKNIENTQLIKIIQDTHDIW